MAFFGGCYRAVSKIWFATLEVPVGVEVWVEPHILLESENRICTHAATSVSMVQQ